jgi:hypothetical protein
MVSKSYRDEAVTSMTTCGANKLDCDIIMCAIHELDRHHFQRRDAAGLRSKRLVDIESAKVAAAAAAQAEFRLITVVHRASDDRCHCGRPALGPHVATGLTL